ncbi:hypothetical protein [Altibacter lentus]|nr:hypothetical protein [Altibacter lentus]
MHTPGYPVYTLTLSQGLAQGAFTIEHTITCLQRTIAFIDAVK